MWQVLMSHNFEYQYDFIEGFIFFFTFGSNYGIMV